MKATASVESSDIEVHVEAVLAIEWTAEQLAPVALVDLFDVEHDGESADDDERDADGDGDDQRSIAPAFPADIRK